VGAALLLVEGHALTMLGQEMGQGHEQVQVVEGFA
jgi:hypothetical protein